MYTAEEATKARVQAYLDALEAEKAGYQARLAAVKSGKSDPRNWDDKMLASSIKAVDDEMKRAKKDLGSAVEEDEGEA